MFAFLRSLQFLQHRRKQIQEAGEDREDRKPPKKQKNNIIGEYPLSCDRRKLANIHGVSEFDDLDWHTISTTEVCQRLSTSPQQGLSNDQIAHKLKEFGPNRPSAPPSQWLRKTIGYLFGGFGPVLFLASILVFIAWKPLGQPPAVANLALGIVLAIVFFAQAAFAFAQG